ncbi:hypothetical protein [Erythrobacter sp. Alg231-14]|uniref:hypothetical protein n=1 Tax=Erythrobacter sp. Alg231-14 TaxID=1922225 RepID=UPI00307B4C5D
MTTKGTALPVGTRNRGGPLIMLGLVLLVWIAARVVLWESPFVAIELPSVELLIAKDDRSLNGAGGESTNVLVGETDPAPPPPQTLAKATIGQPWTDSSLMFGAETGAFQSANDQSAGLQSHNSYGTSPLIASGHSFLMAAAFRVDWADSSDTSVSNAEIAELKERVTEVSPIGPAVMLPIRNLDRWSLDAFAFYRQGSGSTSISQGRVPVYGASQIGANIQYRIAPGSDLDPRAFVRAYRAFVPDGENEVAAGLSARPVKAIPVRVAAEMRVTNNSFGTQARPAAYAVTELPVLPLPFDIRAEAYGGAGYVGGRANTPFVDGQASVSRQVMSIDRPGGRSVNFSVGAGAWGGAQRDASRLDVGPSARIDLTIGDVPARISVDWRERVAGDAAPNSGIAATLSTRF